MAGKLADRFVAVGNGNGKACSEFLQIASKSETGMIGNGGIIVERARADFRQLLATCAVSISQGGYNTMMDILEAGARSVVVPFAGGGETEQTVRAHAFAEHRLVVTVAEDELTPAVLANAVNRAASGTRPASEEVDRLGAERTVALLSAWLAGVPW